MNEIPMVGHLLETSLYVADLDRANEFYQKVFGFRLLLQDHRMCALEVPSSGVLLLFKHEGSLQPSPTPGGIIPPHGGSGALHVCFAIPLGPVVI
jgi:catechol 2,3-dioxygenase-like lactoylglutathione lyase family enzyme